jgi:hypothetical protein
MPASQARMTASCTSGLPVMSTIGDHRSESARKEDGILVEHVDFGELAATGQAPVGPAIGEGALCGVVGVESIFRRLATERGGSVSASKGWAISEKKYPVGRLLDLLETRSR